MIQIVHIINSVIKISTIKNYDDRMQIDIRLKLFYKVINEYSMQNYAHFYLYKLLLIEDLY